MKRLAPLGRGGEPRAKRAACPWEARFSPAVRPAPRIARRPGRAARERGMGPLGRGRRRAGTRLVWIAGRTGPEDDEERTTRPMTTPDREEDATTPPDGEPERRVAVVMITWNRRDETLRSLDVMSRLPERPSIVLVDNGSADGTAEAVAERFPEVRVVALDRNLGAGARTIGVRRVDAPYVAFCDDDTWWEPGNLRRAADLFDAHPRLAIITARVVVGEEQREDPACRVLAESPLPREEGMPGPSLLGFLAGASVVRRSAFLEAGGFDERFRIGGEERLLAVDIVARGGWICYVPELTVHHHPSPIRDHAARRVNILRNDLWFAWMRRPIPAASRATLATLTSREGRRALAAAVRKLPWALRNRRVPPPAVERGLRLLEGGR